MKLIHAITHRKMEIGVACLLLLLMVLVFRESFRLGAGFGGHLAGSAVVGPRPGFFPFVMALLISIGALVVLVQAVRGQLSMPFLEERQGVIDLAKVGIPMMAAIALVPFLGLYIVSAVYLIAFPLWYERAKWYVVVPIGLFLPGSIWWVLEQKFRLIMPKSPWYPAIPF